MRIIVLAFLLITFLAGCGQTGPTDRPSILLIVADDVGYSDLGCYGGEIETSNLDRLASQGLQFTQFKTGSMCAPSRAMLISGQDHHLAGWGRQDSDKQEFWGDKWGYENVLSDRIKAFPEFLQDHGYFTAISGKWHIGKTPESNPKERGFDRSWVLMEGGANHWNNIGLGLLPYHPEIAHYTEDGEEVEYPEGTYSTTHYTDKALEYIRERPTGKPFFTIVSYTAPHWPLQAPEPYLSKYRGVYDRGYDDLRKKRFDRLKELGIVDSGVAYPPGLDHITPWEELDEERKRIESREMEIYAAMVDFLDDDIGRMLGALDEMGDLENTIVLFISDNGADFLDFYRMNAGEFVRRVYDNSYDNMGSPTSFVAYGAEWAQATMIPFSWYKGKLSEGGITAPLIISGKGIRHGNKLINQLTDIRDLAPTILELAGVHVDSQQLNEEGIPAYPGKSLVPLFKGKDVLLHNDEEVFVMDFEGEAYVRKGPWKLLNKVDPLDDDAFMLYNWRTDPGEKKDLREKYPELTKELLEAWNDFKEKMQVTYPKADEEQ